METALALLGGLGLGSALTQYAGYFFAEKKRLNETVYAEKREVFIGLIESLKDKDSPEGFDYYDLRVRLVASRSTIDAITNLRKTEYGSDARLEARDRLVETMRADLDLAD